MSELPLVKISVGIWLNLAEYWIFGKKWLNMA
jgi:hypothetical protein